MGLWGPAGLAGMTRWLDGQMVVQHLPASAGCDADTSVAVTE